MQTLTHTGFGLPAVYKKHISSEVICGRSISLWREVGLLAGVSLYLCLPRPMWHCCMHVIAFPCVNNTWVSRYQWFVITQTVHVAAMLQACMTSMQHFRYRWNRARPKILAAFKPQNKCNNILHAKPTACNNNPQCVVFAVWLSMRFSSWQLALSAPCMHSLTHCQCCAGWQLWQETWAHATMLSLLGGATASKDWRRCTAMTQ